MSEVHVKEGESLDSALKRFKRSCAKAGVLAEVRRRECYESPSVKRRKKSEAPARTETRDIIDRLNKRAERLRSARFLSARGTVNGGSFTLLRRTAGPECPLPPAA